MSNSAILTVRILGEAKDAVNAIGDVGKATDQAGKKSDDFKSKMNKLSVGAAAVAAALIAMGKKCAEAAEQFEESSHGMEKVFGTASDTVANYAQKAAQAMGLSSSAYDDMASTMGEKLQNLGFNQDQAADTTQELMQRAADLAAMLGGSTEDAVTALSSAMSGQYKSAKNLGIIIDATTVKNWEAANGMSGLTGEAKKTADAQAALAIIMQQSSNAAGSFADESTTATGAQEIATASWENAKATLGEALLPTIAAFTLKLADAAQWLSQHATLVQNVAIAMGVLVAAITAFRIAMTIAEVAQKVFNITLSASPIFIITGIIMLVIAAIVLLITHWDWVKEKVQQFGQICKDIFGWLWDKVKGFGEFFANVFRTAIDSVVGFFQDLWQKIADIVTTVKNWFSDLGHKILDAFHISLPGWVTKALNFLGLMSPGSELTMVSTQQYLPAPAVVAAAQSFSLPRLNAAISSASLENDNNSRPTVINVTVEVPPSVNPAEVGREVAKSLAAFRQIGGQF